MTVMTHVIALEAGQSSRGHLSLLHRHENGHSMDMTQTFQTGVRGNHYVCGSCEHVHLVSSIENMSGVKPILFRALYTSK